jgi:hypothetical protein
MLLYAVALSREEHGCALQVGYLEKVKSGNLRPERAGGLSPRFQPWEPTNQSDAQSNIVTAVPVGVRL